MPLFAKMFELAKVYFLAQCQRFWENTPIQSAKKSTWYCALNFRFFLTQCEFHSVKFVCVTCKSVTDRRRRLVGVVLLWRSDFEVKLIRECFRLFKSNFPYFNSPGRDLTVFEADQFIYFIRLVAMDRTCVSPIFTWYFNNLHSLVILVYVKRV